MDFSFPFLAPAISGSSDNYPIRRSIWPLYTPTPYKVYLQQTPAVSSQTDVTTSVEAGFRYGTPQLRSGREDICSARQAYAHAQQEEVTEEGDLCADSQEVS